MTPRPSWPSVKNSGTVRTSTTAPISETNYNAMNFWLWKHIGHEFMIKSNINNWISCRESGGSLVNWRDGGLRCRVINNLTRRCCHIVPNRIQTATRDYYGIHKTGPNIYSSQPGSGLKKYYYLEDSTAGKAVLGRLFFVLTISELFENV